MGGACYVYVPAYTKWVLINDEGVVDRFTTIKYEGGTNDYVLKSDSRDNFYITLGANCLMWGDTEQNARKNIWHSGFWESRPNLS